jgi:hypothetical protein
MKQFKLLHKIIRRLADGVTIVFILACILFALRGF